MRPKRGRRGRHRQSTCGDQIEVFHHNGDSTFITVEEIYNKKGKSIQVASGGIGEISINCPVLVNETEVISIIPQKRDSKKLNPV